MALPASRNESAARGPIKARGQNAAQELGPDDARLERALDSAEVGIWDFFPQTKRLVASGTCLALLGYAPGADVEWADSFWPRVHMDDRARVEEALARVLAGEDEYEVEHRVVSPEGGERWLFAKGRALRDANGQVLRMSGTVLDVTLRKREEWAQLLFAEAAAAMTSLDAAECLRGAARALVARFADLVMAQTYEPSGGVLTEVTASEQVPADLPGIIRNVWSRYPLDFKDPIWKHPSVFPRFGEGEVRRFTRSEEHLALLQRVRPLSSMIVPLYVRGDPVGALTIARIRDGSTRFDERDLFTSSELAHRVSARLDNVWLFGAEQRARGRFQALVEATSQSVWTSDARGLAKESAGPSQKLIEAERGKGLGVAWLAEVHPEDRERVRAAWHEAVEREAPYAEEFRLRRPDRSYRWTVARGTPVRDLEGRVVEWVGVSVDVQEQREVRARLEESEASYRRIVETANEGILTLDLEGRTTFANRRMAETLETTVEDLRARSVYDFLFPENVPSMRETLALHAAGHKAEPGEHRLRSALGRELWVRCSATRLVGPSGRVEGSLWLVTDITEAKRAETYRARYELLAKHARDVVMFISPQGGRVLEVNEAAVRAYGYTHAEMLTLTIADLRAPETRADIPATQLRAAAEEGILYQTTHVRKDGSRFPVEASARGTTLEGERVILSVIRDISARRHAEHERDRNERFRELFIGMLGHDLRNPLSAVLSGAVLVLRRGALSDPDVRTLQRIHSSGLRMGRMIEQILDFTRSRLGGGIPVEPKPFDLSKLLVRVVEELTAADPEPAITLQHGGVTTGEWDEDRLEQVFSNLIHNALQHGRGGRVDVTLNGGEREIVVRVHNDGEPIHPALLPVIFDPFQQVEMRSRGRAGGLGLGLYISQQIVAAHGGKIEVVSRVGEGTTFDVMLPRYGPV
jgi:PAS domain S-box-containing protein